MFFAIASMALSAASAYQQGRVQAATAEYNAKIAQQQAEAQAMALDAERGHKADANRNELSSMRARAGASGVAMDVGSPLQLMANEAIQGGYDIAEMHRQSQIVRDTGEAQASLLSMQGDQAKTASYWNIGSALAKGSADTYKAHQTNQMYKGE